MHLMRVWSTCLLFSVLIFASLASASPLDLANVYSGPKYLSLSGSDALGNNLQATIMIDPSHRLVTDVGSRNFLASYVDGNLFGDRTNINGGAIDFNFNAGLPLVSQRPMEGYLFFDWIPGHLYNYRTWISALTIGDTLTYTYSINGLIDLPLTVTAIHSGTCGETAPIPEPATIFLLGSGLFGIWRLRRR